MTEETIVKDVSDADNLIEGEESEQPEVTIPDNPISRREAKMKDLHEKRVEERESDRRSAALINNPDLTEEEYDEQNESLSGNEATEPAGEGEQSPNLDNGDNLQPEAGKESSPEELPSATLNGWHKNDAGLTVRQLSVNGRMVEVTEDQYERFAQKDMAGDEKLNRAAAVEKVLTQREKSILERERAFEQKRNQPPQRGADADLDSMIDDFQEAITEGDLDVARDRMRDLIQSGRQEPTLSMDDVVAQATTRMERNAQQKAVADDISSGYEAFKEQYSDVFADRDALHKADYYIKKLEADNPGMSFSARALEAGRIARQEHGLSGGGENLPTGNAEQLRAERGQRKAKLTPIPSSGQRHKVKEKPKRDLSPQSTIARMRAGRAR
ncbi:MAG: hypothetical protein DRH08_14450 [Deltaproteobacteria bacterium]|nr:MAG: hypothetical protein DRR42_19625 [Gammaproteobacteria bacterium]RLB61062.1 MAG: hypothetical protein DRH08_14450 [Deltaproteobacteria bacterium]